MRKSVIGVIVLILIGVGAFVLFSSSDDDSDTAAVDTSDATDTTNEAAANSDDSEEPATDANAVQSFSADEVATHNSEDDCWTIIDSKVYDITEYIPRHPGGDEILRACGADGSTLFNQRQTEDGEQVGTGQPHSGSASGILEGFQVGELAQ